MNKFFSAFFIGLLIGQVHAATSQTGQLDFNDGGNLPRNYIKYGNATGASDLTKWTKYKDTAGLEPLDCTGGSPTVGTLTRSTSSPLRGAASFLWTKTGSTAQGEGFSYLMNIDRADRGKSFTASFDYEKDSGTLATDDLRIYGYDVTNSKIIYPDSSTIENIIGTATKISRFNLDSTAAQVRLCIHTSSPSAAAYAVKMGNFKFTQGTQASGPVVTNPVAYTPTFTGFGVVSAVDIKSHRDGAFLVINGRFTTGTSTAVEGRMTMGFNGVDGGLVSAVGSLNIVGKGNFNASATTFFSGMVLQSEPGNSYLTFGQESSTRNGLTKVNASDFGSGSVISISDVRIPIVGWSSNQTTFSESNGRPIRAQYYLATTYNPGANTPINFDTKIEDNTGSVTIGAGTWKFTSPENRCYTVKTYYGSSAAAAFYLYKGNSAYKRISYSYAGTPQASSADVCLKAGEFIDIRPNAGTNVDGGTLSGVASWIDIATNDQNSVQVTGDSNLFSSVNPGLNDLTWGEINQSAAGTCPVTAGKGFTTACSSAGVVMVTFTVAKRVAPFCLGTLSSNVNSTTCRASGVTTTGFNFTCADTSGTGSNQARNFICINPN